MTKLLGMFCCEIAW